MTTKRPPTDWDDLYEYVRSDILGYDKNQSLSNTMVLRLKGLLTGKYMENKKAKDVANYSYKTILYTFKLCSPQIRNALSTNDFRDENHKFNYILKIVENNINDVYIRLQNAEKAKEKVKTMDTSNLHNEGAEYVSTEKKSNTKLERLW